MIRGGIAANVIPKDCEFQFDMRTLPQASADALYQEIRAYAEVLAREMQAIDPQAGIDLVWASQTAGLAAAETDAIVQWAMRLARQNHGGQGVVWNRSGFVPEDGRSGRDMRARRHRRRRIGPMNSSRSSSSRNARGS